VGQDLVLDDEGLLRVEAENPLGRGDLLGPELGAVDAAGVLLVRGRPADDRAQRDHRGLGGLGLGRADRRVELLHVLHVVPGLRPVHPGHVPAVGLVAAEHVLGERHVGVVLDRDVVLVVDHHQVAQLLDPGQRGRLGGDALLQVPVGGDDVDGVVEDGLPGRGVGVEQAPGVALGVGEAHGRRQALTERTGGDLHPGGVPVLRVPRGLRPPGPQGLDVLQLHPVARQEQLQVQRQGGVPGGEDEPVPARPPVVRGVVAHHLLEQKVGRRGQRHRRARVAVAHLLHRVRGQHPHRVHGTLVLLGPSQLHIEIGHDRFLLVLW